MINEFEVGSFGVATAGHDSGECYIILKKENEYVYLVDGRIRTLDCPKKKKVIHMKKLDHVDEVLAAKVRNATVKNEEIKRAIKLLQYGKSSQEVE